MKINKSNLWQLKNTICTNWSAKNKQKHLHGLLKVQTKKLYYIPSNFHLFVQMKSEFNKHTLVYAIQIVILLYDNCLGHLVNQDWFPINYPSVPGHEILGHVV